MKRLMISAGFVFLICMSAASKPTGKKFLVIQGERWELIQKEQYLDLERGTVVTKDVSEFGWLYPKKRARCPKGYHYEEIATTTLFYQHCVMVIVEEDQVKLVVGPRGTDGK